MKRRRKLIIALSVGALSAPFGSFAQQQAKVWRVGYLTLRPRIAFREEAFIKALRELEYIEGKNLIFEWRFADGQSERLPVLAAELALSKVDIIVTSATQASIAAQKLTSAIPIVIVGVGNPVGAGLVKSLARPDGNITGLSNLTGDLGPKHLEMLLSIVPKLSRVAVLVDPSNPTHSAILKSVQAAALRTGVKVVPAEARSSKTIEDAFSVMMQEGAKAVIVCGALFNNNLRQIAALAEKHKLPSIAASVDYAEAGGLTSYGQNQIENYRRAAIYVDKIFKGANPGDLPVEQPTKFELVINKKTAKALGIKIPQSILVQATKVIE